MKKWSDDGAWRDSVSKLTQRGAYLHAYVLCIFIQIMAQISNGDNDRNSLPVPSSTVLWLASFFCLVRGETYISFRKQSWGFCEWGLCVSTIHYRFWCAIHQSSQLHNYFHNQNWFFSFYFKCRERLYDFGFGLKNVRLLTVECVKNDFFRSGYSSLNRSQSWRRDTHTQCKMK